MWKTINSHYLIVSRSTNFFKTRIYQETKILDLRKYTQQPHAQQVDCVCWNDRPCQRLRPLQPPPFFQCIVGIHVLFCGSSVYFLPSLSDHMGWLVIILVSSSYPPFECRQPGDVVFCRTDGIILLDSLRLPKSLLCCHTSETVSGPQTVWAVDNFLQSTSISLTIHRCLHHI